MSTANWKPGDNLLCVDSKPLGQPSLLVCGQEYKLQRIHRCTGHTYVDVGVPCICQCVWCVDLSDTAYHFAWRFIKLDPGLEEEYQRQLTLQKMVRHAMNYSVGPRKLIEVLKNETNR